VETITEQLIKNVIMVRRLAALIAQNLKLVTVVQVKLEVLQDVLEFVEMQLDYYHRFVIMGINLDVLLVVK
jgi:hypothetical protein